MCLHHLSTFTLRVCINTPQGQDHHVAEEASSEGCSADLQTLVHLSPFTSHQFLISQHGTLKKKIHLNLHTIQTLHNLFPPITKKQKVHLKKSITHPNQQNKLTPTSSTKERKIPQDKIIACDMQNLVRRLVPSFNNRREWVTSSLNSPAFPSGR